MQVVRMWCLQVVTMSAGEDGGTTTMSSSSSSQGNSRHVCKGGLVVSRGDAQNTGCSSCSHSQQVAILHPVNKVCCSCFHPFKLTPPAAPFVVRLLWLLLSSPSSAITLYNQLLPTRCCWVLWVSPPPQQQQQQQCCTKHSAQQ